MDVKEMSDAEMDALVQRAMDAGVAAGAAVTPEPMTVVGGGETYHVPEGLCGFAWVVVSPATTRFAKRLKTRHGWRKHWRSGVSYWVSLFDQSYERKKAYAEAFARVLREAGVQAVAGSRLD